MFASMALGITIPHSLEKPAFGKLLIPALPSASKRGVHRITLLVHQILEEHGRIAIANRLALGFALGLSLLTRRGG